MTKLNLGRCVALASFLSFTVLASANTPPIDADGYKNPLDRLVFVPEGEHDEFVASTIDALNVYDPFESINRRTYQFNYRFDQYVYLPIVRGYRYVTPKPVRKGIQNFTSNLREIPTFFNSVAQFKGRKAGITTARFMFNTVFGVFGIWDPATKMGLEQQSADFGQTLAFYGVPNGPYIIIPFMGPSNVRDGIGLYADFEISTAVNAFNNATASNRHLELWGLRAINIRDSIDMAYGKLNSPFEYETVRYIYTKAREVQTAE